MTARALRCVTFVSLFCCWACSRSFCEVAISPGNLHGYQFVDKYRTCYFMGVACVREVTRLTNDAGVQTRATLVVVEPLKGPEAGTVLEVAVDPDTVGELSPGTNILGAVWRKNMDLWEVYPKDQWPVVKERVALIEQGLYPPPKAEIPEEMKTEYWERRKRYEWIRHKYEHKKKVSKEEFEREEAAFEEWLDRHPEVKEYFAPEVHY